MLIFNYGSTHFSNKVVLTQFISAVVWDAILSTLVLFYRSTWAVFPYTLLFLCWHSLALRAGKIFSLIKEKKNQPVTADAPKGFMLGASTAMGWVLLWGFLGTCKIRLMYTLWHNHHVLRIYHVPSILGKLLDLISPAKINISEPRFESYDPLTS